MRLFHVSFDIVENFTPRIPPDWARMEGENATIPRICVAKNIADCLNGMPLAGETVKKMEALGIPVIIHVYEFEAERPYVMSNKEVSVYVPDAELTGEMWILSHGKLVGRTDYELTNIEYKETRLFLADRCFITKFDAKKVRFSDNVRNLMDRVGYVEENRELVYGMMVEKTFTSVVNAMYKDFLEILERKKSYAEN